MAPWGWEWRLQCSVVSGAAAVLGQQKEQWEVKAALAGEAGLWVGLVSAWRVDADPGAGAQMVWQVV